MESQPKNPEFRINPENFLPCGILLTLFLLQTSVDKSISDRPLCID